MAPRRTYAVLPPLPDSVRDELREHGPLTAQLLYNRGIITAEAAERFLHPDYNTELHDPFLFTDMEKAVSRILEAIRENEHVVIYTDYDCDGIPGGVILHDLFEAVGFKNFENYIPHRHHEGYGFNKETVPTFKECDTRLIITVDCGIVDHEATEKANELGIDVIVTDHHEPSEKLPPAYAVINPKRDDAYPFQGICGSGVAYKLAQAVLTRGKEEKLIDLKDGLEKWWLDMVGLATIADMVPLIDENRVLATYGLSVLRKSRRPGLQHLLRKAGGDQRYLTEDDIGFTIAPRINAASRMDDPEHAFHMLRTKDEAEAGEYVRHLEKLNNERKGIVAAMTKEAKRRMQHLETLPSVIVMGNPEWRPSLVGLVANSLVEEFRRPVFLWGRDGRDIIKGSARSDGYVSALSLMQEVADTFLFFGGHHASGGFSVKEDMIHTFPDVLNEAYVRLGDRVFSAEYETRVDAELLLDDITERFVRELAQLAPFGVGNEKPVFRFSHVVPKRVQTFGSTQNHTKLIFETGGRTIEAITFFKTPEQFDTVPQSGAPLTLIAHVEDSFFMGKRQTRLRIIDLIAG